MILADTLPVVPTAVQVFQKGSRDLSPYLKQPRAGRWAAVDASDALPYCVRPDAAGAGAYSSYPAGMEVFAWFAVLWGSTTGLDLGNDWTLMWLEVRTAAIIGGSCIVLFFLCALRIGSPLAAWVTAALLATGSVVPSTLAQWLWQQSGVVFWMLVVLLLELRARGKPGIAGTIAQAIACSLMLACRPSAATFLVPFGSWVLIRDHRRGLVLGLAALLAYLPWAVMYWSIYRTPFGPSMAFLGQTWTFAGNVGGVLFSPGRGLFVYQPWMVLLVLLAWKQVRTDPGRPLPVGWYWFCFASIACHILLVGSWGVWWGGFCWGSRLAAEVVVISALLVVRPVGWLSRRYWGCALVIVLATIGILLHRCYTHGDASGWNVAVDIDRHPERLWDLRDPPFLYEGRGK